MATIVVTIMTLLLAWSAGAQTAAPAAADPDQARVLLRRYERGEHLTDAELEQVQAIRADRARRMGEGAPPSTNIFTNVVPRIVGHCTPLTVIPKGETYKGETGGLYGDGLNTPPPELEAAARKALAGIVPRDIDGAPDKSGLMVLLAIGMSNTSQEFQRFKQLADADRTKSSAVVVVDGAQGGRDAAAWDPADPQSLNVWRETERALKMAGVTPEQVQVVWVKHAMQRPSALGEFPAHADALREHLTAILQEARRRYPHLALAYLSSRTYGGYSKNDLSPEPYAFESAFAVRGVILDQLHGNRRLNADPAAGDVMAPVLLWGPYLWADGALARPDDGFTWEPADVAKDGLHPSPAGREKVAGLLLQFFRTNPLAAPWYTGKGISLEPMAAPEQGPAPEAL